MRESILQIFFLLLVSGFSLYSCQLRPVKLADKMKQVEQIMDERPDSALLILNTIDSVDISSNEEKAFYALLKTQALNKNFIDETDDTLVNIALNYYETHENLRYRMLARYYAGRIAYYGKNYPKALMLFIKAFDDAKTNDDDYWIGTTAGAVSDVYNATYNDLDAKIYAQICYDYLLRSGKLSHAYWSLFDLAIVLYNIGEYEKAEEYCAQLLNLSQQIEDNDLYLSVLRLLGKLSIKSQQYDLAVKRWTTICQTDGCCHNDTVLSAIAQVFAKRHINNDSITKEIFSRPLDGVDAWLGYEIYMVLHDTTKAFVCLQNLNNWNNREVDKRMSRGLGVLLQDYYESEKTLNELRLRDATVVRWVIVAIFIIVISLIITYGYKYRRRQQDKIDYYFYIAENFKEVLKLKNTKNESMMELVHELLVSEYKIIDDRCKHYHSTLNLKSKKKISDDMKSFIERFASDMNIEELEKRINKYHDNLMSDFRNDFPELKNEDYKLYIFSILGFSSTAIALFLNENKVEAIYSRKARLKIKIRLIGEMHSHRYLTYV